MKHHRPLDILAIATFGCFALLTGMDGAWAGTLCFTSFAAGELYLVARYP